MRKARRGSVKQYRPLATARSHVPTPVPSATDPCMDIRLECGWSIGAWIPNGDSERVNRFHTSRFRSTQQLTTRKRRGLAFGRRFFSQRSLKQPALGTKWESHFDRKPCQLLPLTFGVRATAHYPRKPVGPIELKAAVDLTAPLQM